MDKLHRIYLMYHIEGFIDPLNMPINKMLDYSVINLRRPLSFYSDIINEAKAVYNNARLNSEGISSDILQIRAAYGVYMAVSYKEFDAVNLVLFVQDRHEKQISFPGRSNFNPQEYLNYINYS